MLRPISLPKIEKHNDVWVVRDDLITGGSKARIFKALMHDRPEQSFIYAGPVFGAAQVALAATAYQAGKEAVIFVAKRSCRAPRTQLAQDFGAKIIEVSPGYLNVVQARAREYAERTGAYLIPFGGNSRYACELEKAAKSLSIVPDVVWCAAGSGVLSEALARAWPRAIINAVQVGKAIETKTQSIRLHSVDMAFETPFKGTTPFPAHENYEAKAWAKLSMKAESGKDVLFWNVAA